MKKLLLLFICATFLINTEAQYNRDNKTIYLGLGAGINNYTALFGVSGSLRAVDNLFLRGGLGIGGWGYKLSLGLKYDLSDNGGLNFGAGYSVCPGENNLKMNMPVESGETKLVTINYLMASTINLTIGYNFIIGKSNIFYLETGYAIPLETSPWKVTDGSVLSSTSLEALRLIQPGGIILALGFMFGIQ